MPDLRLQTIARTDRRLMSALMDEEEQSWSSELDWDYSPIRRILDSFIDRHTLPGFVAFDDQRALGYTYFLIQRERAVIGALYALQPGAQAVADQLLSIALSDLMEYKTARRIEAQVMSLNGLDLFPIFSRQGFEHYLRDYLELNLTQWSPHPTDSDSGDVVRWDSSHLSLASEVAFRSYRNEVDTAICDDYGSVAGCETYLRSLIEHPGCGMFLPKASFVCVDSHGTPCGFIISSRISATSAMIPQISVAPSHQGLGFGGRLIGRAFSCMQEQGFKTVRLTVTRRNRRAYEWYLRLGFLPRRSFGAYVWMRK